MRTGVFMKLAFFLLIKAATINLLFCASTIAKPNVILIFVDDLGYCDSEIYGCENVPTPNLKKLAQDGVSFASGYVTSPVCSPSRASLLTGKYQQRFGHEFLPDALPNTGLPESEITLATKLQSLNYYTGMVGKWHLGSANQFHPINRGFDSFFGLLSSGSDYLDPTRPDAKIISRLWRGLNAPVQKEGDPWLGRDRDTIFINKKKIVEESYLTDAFTREAVTFINEHKSKPFFLYLPYTAPHGPLQTTQRYYDRFDDVENENQRVYASMISALDIGIGEILETLDKLNLSENTLIVLMSDNGAGVADYGSNSPFRLGKHTLFEGGVRVPFVMRWPNQLERGLLYKNPVSALDIFPTVLNAAGGKAGSLDLDGVDLLPFLKGEKSDKPHQTFYWRNSPNWAIRDGSYKLINAGGINWLYDLNVDLGETDNIASEYPNVVEKLTLKFNEWDAKNIEPSWPPYSAKTHSALKVDGVPIKWTL